MACKDKRNSEMKKEKKDSKEIEVEKVQKMEKEEKQKKESEGKEKKEDNKKKETDKKVEEEDLKEPPIDTVDDLKEQLDSMNGRYLRLMAEFDNFKKRTIRDYERLVESANEKLILELVDVRENFERALKSGETNTNYQSFYDGIKLIFNKFNEVLSKNGLEPFAESGDLFDPQIHDALMKMPHETVPEEHVAEIYEKGYSLKGKVIKHAKVIVSSGKSECSNEESENDGDQ